MNRKNTVTATGTTGIDTTEIHGGRRRRLVRTGVAVLAVAGFAVTGLGVAHATGTSDAAPGEVVVIDGNTNPAGAKAALDLYGTSTDASFTPTVQPTYTTVDFHRAVGPDNAPLPVVIGDGKTAQGLVVSHQETNTWSLGGSVQVSLGFDLLGAIDASVSEKFTGSHSWTTGTSDSETVSITPALGKTAWLEVQDSNVTFTGDFDFTANGIRYNVDNVTITQSAAPGLDTNSAATYRVEEMDTKNTGAPNGLTGKVDLAKLPKLQAYISAGH